MPGKKKPQIYHRYTEREKRIPLITILELVIRHLRWVEDNEIVGNDLRPHMKLIQVATPAHVKHVERPRIKSTRFVRRQVAKPDPTIHVQGSTNQDLTSSGGGQHESPVVLVSQ